MQGSHDIILRHLNDQPWTQLVEKFNKCQTSMYSNLDHRKFSVVSSACQFVPNMFVHSLLSQYIVLQSSSSTSAFLVSLYAISLFKQGLPPLLVLIIPLSFCPSPSPSTPLFLLPLVFYLPSVVRRNTLMPATTVLKHGLLHCSELLHVLFYTGMAN